MTRDPDHTLKQAVLERIRLLTISAPRQAPDLLILVAVLAVAVLVLYFDVLARGY